MEYKSSFSSQTITAIDLEANEKAIDSIVEGKTIQFNKSRIRKELKKQKDLLKIEQATDEVQLTKEQSDKIKLTIINDEETKRFRAHEYAVTKAQRDNYIEIRKTIDGLNDLPEYAAEIEKMEIQTIRDLRKFDDIVTHSITHNNNFYKLRTYCLNRIDTYIKSFEKSLNSNDDYDTLSHIMVLREMYLVDDSIDDFDLFEKYNLENNIDISNKIAEILFKKYASGDFTKNIVNEFIPESNTIKTVSKLVHQRIITNKMLGVLFSDRFITNNQVTTLETMYVTNREMYSEKENAHTLIYRTRTIGELLLEITNAEISSVNKAERQQIYMTYDGMRPAMEEYHKWNGMQVFDIDLKFWIKRCGGNIAILKEAIHNLMQEFHWYLWICTSASGNGLHIYTKVTPPHHVYTLATDNEYICQYWHQVSYATKLANVYDVLKRLHYITGNGINFTEFWFEKKDVVMFEENNLEENRYVDNVVSRITAGIRLSYDNHPLINHNFVDLHCGLALGQTLDGYEVQQTIDRVILRINQTTKNIDDNLAVQSPDDLIKKQKEKIDLSKFISLGGDMTALEPLKKINYNTRYNVCNTLASIFGKEGLPIAHTILDSTACKNVGEINSFYACAMSNRKEPTKFGLEILKKAGIIKTIEPEVIEAVESGFKYDLKRQIEKSLNNTNLDVTIALNKDQYLGSRKDEIVEMLSGNYVNIIFSPPGTGKTELIKQLAKDGKRILLVLPYISVIKNKIETDESITEMFDTFYGTTDIKDIEYGRNAVTTFDKFSRSNFEKLSKMFDYIMIDESHLLFTSSYRIEATSNAIKKIKELFFISSNDPFAAKLVLLTGTETGESSFFSQVANIIRISKPHLDKHMEFLICGDTLDSITRLASKAATLITEGYKLMIPTNKGEIYSEKIIGMIQYLLQRPLKYGYYKRSNTEQEICRLINSDNTVGDYDIVFCSNYLSVGVDINDKCKFASLYLGTFSGYEIEQFNARVRKTGIRSIYCVTTNKADGTTNETLLQEPDLLLKITDEDQLYFIDDKSIAGAKTEFIASYDPVLHRIVTPGFSLMNGKILFNLEEYELMSFEDKYSLCMEHPIKVARELAKYGYKVSVSTEFEGLSLSEQETLKKMGIEAAKEEKVRKHNLLVGTFVDLIKQNSYINQHGLEFNNVIDWIGKNSDKITEDRELTREVNGQIEPCFVQVIFDIFATPKEIFVRSREALEKMFPSAKYLIKRYSSVKALDIIFQYVDDSGILKQKLFSRAINLLKLIDSSEANELADPIAKSLEKMYDFVDKFETRKDFRIGYETYQSIMEAWCNEYIDALGIKINTKYGFDKIRDGLTEMLQDIATKQSSKNGIRFTYNKMPDQDSSTVLNRRSIDGIIQNMFHITEALITVKSTARQKHIILSTQTF